MCRPKTFAKLCGATAHSSRDCCRFSGDNEPKLRSSSRATSFKFVHEGRPRRNDEVGLMLSGRVVRIEPDSGHLRRACAGDIGIKAVADEPDVSRIDVQ